MRFKAKTLFLTFMLILAILMISTASLAKEKTSRYFIKSSNQTLMDQLKAKHVLSGGFTAELSDSKIKEMKKAGFEMQKVPVRQLVGIGSSTLPSIKRKCLPSEQIPWGVEMLNGGKGGKGVKVAILDTGAMTGHSDLKSNVKRCMNTIGYGVQLGCQDTNGHGTHVAGTIAANGGSDKKGIYGVAPQTELMIIKVFTPYGAYDDDIAEGIYYATDKGANIISMSFGGPDDSPILRDAVEYASSKGVLLVASAGNEEDKYDHSIGYPAAYPEVIAVGAIDYEKTPLYWSSHGFNDGDYSKEEGEVDFAAPGVGIESIWNDGCYEKKDGTSMAAPHISGLAAKLWRGSAAKTRAYLQQLARKNDIGAPGDDEETGFGLPIAP